jgi:hypothetical protein
VAVVAAAVHALGPTAARAQVVVSGSVSGEGVTRPLAGAVVEAVGESGDTLRGVAELSGEYRLTLPSTGRWQLTASYLGFESATQQVEAGGLRSGVVDFVLQPSPYLLDGLTVTAGARCPATDDADEMIGLLGQLLALEISPDPVAQMTWEVNSVDVPHKGIDRDGDWRESSEMNVAWDTVSFVAAGAHAAFGLIAPTGEDFIVPAFPGGESFYAWVFRAPSLHQVLSEDFLGRYCLDIDRADPTGRVGLRFTVPPGEERDRDVEGVLWLPARAEPSIVLEFSYSSFPPDPEGGPIERDIMDAAYVREKRRTGESLYPVPTRPVRPGPGSQNRLEYAPVEDVGWVAHTLDLRHPEVEHISVPASATCCAEKMVWLTTFLKVRRLRLLSYGVPRR